MNRPINRVIDLESISFRIHPVADVENNCDFSYGINYSRSDICESCSRISTTSGLITSVEVAELLTAIEKSQECSQRCRVQFFDVEAVFVKLNFLIILCAHAHASHTHTRTVANTAFFSSYIKIIRNEVMNCLISDKVVICLSLTD
jgi:hypothetical protein